MVRRPDLMLAAALVFAPTLVAATGPDALSGPDQAPMADAALPENLVGKPVHAADGQAVGQVADVLVDPRTGAVRALVLATEGFQGAEGRPVLLHRGEVRLDAEGDGLRTRLDADAVAALPPFDPARLEDGVVALGER